MEFEQLLLAVQDEPVFQTGLLLSGAVDAMDVRKQLSRWTAAGKLIQLRRGLYCLAPPYQKQVPHSFLIANHLQRGSYVSLQSALSFYNMIPEGVPATTSLSTGRPEHLNTPLGVYSFRHIQLAWLTAYRLVEVVNGQRAFVATPEKALLDLLYLQTGSDTLEYLRALRLQNLDQLDTVRLEALAKQSGQSRVERALKIVRELMREEAEEFRPL